MRAFYAREFGGPDVMELGDLADPRPAKGQVALKVLATSVNPLDYKLRSGQFKLVTGGRFPKVFGADVAGEVIEVGDGVAGIEPGNQLYGYIPIFLRKQGAHAERVVMPAKDLHAIPAGLSPEQAAALPVAALTALNGWRQCGELSGKRVVVNGATGGVGHFAVQIARARGATVTAVCSARNAELAAKLGADDVIDYRKEDFTERDTTYDIVFDVFAHLGYAAARRVLPRDGYYVTPLPRPGLIVRGVLNRLTGGVRVIVTNYRGKPDDYAELAGLIADGAVTPTIGATYDLADAAEAFAILEKGGLAGKVVIRCS